jgi:hypothetical protein
VGLINQTPTKEKSNPTLKEISYEGECDRKKSHLPRLKGIGQQKSFAPLS